MIEPRDSLDVSLEDEELMGEVGLLSEVMAAVHDVVERLPQHEVDLVLGVEPP